MDCIENEDVDLLMDVIKFLQNKKKHSVKALKDPAVFEHLEQCEFAVRRAHRDLSRKQFKLESARDAKIVLEICEKSDKIINKKPKNT